MAVSESSREGKEPKARKPKAKKGAKDENDIQAPPEQDTPDAPAEHVPALDFSQPTRFTADIRHRIASALNPFCEALAARLGSDLKVDVQLTVGEIAQHTWAGAKARLPADSVAVAVEEEAIARHMLLSVELPLLLQALECMLGGSAAEAPAQRRLTEIDWVLTRGLLDTVVAEMSASWGDLGGPELARGEVDLEGDAGVLTPVGEPALAVTLCSSIDGAGSGMCLLIPWAAVEPIAESIRSAGAEAPGAGGEGEEALRRGLAGAQVLLRAEVGSVQMPIERMLDLVPGALVGLSERAEDGVRLYAEGVSLGRGRPGRSGTRRAIKLQSTSEPPTRAATYATLGRAELERARAHVAGTRETGEGREILRSIFVRVWAELGRTHLPLGRALELTPGVVVELDQDAQAPVELFANGLCFASGSLVVTGEGEWGVQLNQLV
jgi:flagellar motor switch protein FliM